MKPLVIVFFAAMILSSCVSSQREEMMQEDLFKVQTRLLKLERRFTNDTTEAKAKEENANKNIASASVQLDRVNSDLEKVKGDIDALRVGVRTGHLPGEAQSEESLPGQLETLKARVLALEEAQVEMLKTITAQKTTNQNSATKKGGLSSVDSFRAALSGKKYKEIIEEAPGKIKSLSGKSQQELKFIYAESLFRTNRHSDAALVYNELIKDNALPEKQAYIYLKIADAFRLLKDKDAAIVYYKELIDKFPKASEEITKAKQQLDSLAKNASSKKKTGS